LFDREIDVGIPNAVDRLEILRIHTRNMTIDDVNLKQISNATHGYVGRDLELLCSEAALQQIREQKNISLEDKINAGLLNKLIITSGNLKAALNKSNPTALLEMNVEVPTIMLEDIGCPDKVKHDLEQIVKYSLQHREKFFEFGTTPSTDVILYGPAGCGESLE
jgi:transitional endoplasmic reticulum ATPase